MQNLQIIENELVSVYETNTGEKVVYGTDLHKILGVKSKFADWVKNRLTDCEALENEDYDSFSKILEKGGRPQTEYIIKLDTAKEMAMLERNEKGKQVRRYFIQVEKKYKRMHPAAGSRRVTFLQEIKAAERVTKDMDSKQRLDFYKEIYERHGLKLGIETKDIQMIEGKGDRGYCSQYREGIIRAVNEIGSQRRLCQIYTIAKRMNENEKKTGSLL